jgi:hypothetical protein
MEVTLKDFDLETRKREITVIVNDICQMQHALKVQELGGLCEFDRMEAMDILNRIERRMLSNARQVTRSDRQEEATQEREESGGGGQEACVDPEIRSAVLQDHGTADDASAAGEYQQG